MFLLFAHSHPSTLIAMKKRAKGQKKVATVFWYVVDQFSCGCTANRLDLKKSVFFAGKTSHDQLRNWWVNESKVLKCCLGRNDRIPMRISVWRRPGWWVQKHFLYFQYILVETSINLMDKNSDQQVLDRLSRQISNPNSVRHILNWNSHQAAN